MSVSVSSILSGICSIEAQSGELCLSRVDLGPMKVERIPKTGFKTLVEEISGVKMWTDSTF